MTSLKIVFDFTQLHFTNTVILISINEIINKDIFNSDITQYLKWKQIKTTRKTNNKMMSKDL